MNTKIIDINNNISGYPPVIDREEEYNLAVDLYENHNLEAAKKLVLSQMRFVSYIAGEYRGYGLEHEDLVQEGTIGLMKSVKKYNPYKKVRLSTFAVYWIRAEIHEFIFKNWKIVKLATTKAQRKLFFKLNKARVNIDGQLSDKQIIAIAEDLNVSRGDVIEMEKRLTFSPIRVDNDYEITAESPQDGGLIELDDFSRKNKLMHDALIKLDDVEISIIKARFLSEEKVSLKELAVINGVSIETIRNWEKKAVNKLREHIKSKI